MIAEWNIRACASQCAGCHRPFDDGERLTSRIIFTPEGYLREDYCRSCWPTRPAPDATLSDWSAIFRAPAPPPPACAGPPSTTAPACSPAPSAVAPSEFLPPPRGGGDPTPSGVGEEKSVAPPHPVAPPCFHYWKFRS